MSRGSEPPSIKLASSPPAPATSFWELLEKCPEEPGAVGSERSHLHRSPGKALLQGFLGHVSLGFWRVLGPRVVQGLRVGKCGVLVSRACGQTSPGLPVRGSGGSF